MTEDASQLVTAADGAAPAVDNGTGIEAQPAPKQARRKQRKSDAASGSDASAVAVARPAAGSKMQGRVLRLNGTFGFIQ